MRFLMLGILLGFPLAEAVVMYMIGQNNLYWLAAWLILAAVIGVVAAFGAKERYRAMILLLVALVPGSCLAKTSFSRLSPRPIRARYAAAPR